jgi:predicted PhzF superfamily epimerase YddE/YHI9
MTKLHVLRVFTDPEGGHGNRLGVVLDGGAVARGDRQKLARHLGFSETVFVDEPASGSVRIFTPATELPFAGHPSVGTAWLLLTEGHQIDSLRPPAGIVRVRQEQGLTWIRARPEWAPDITIQEFASPGEVDALPGPTGEVSFLYAWAWLDPDRRLVRSRGFPRGLGIVEDEATGAAAVRLTHLLGSALIIHQGRGSVIYSRPLDDGFVEVGGRVVLDEVREDAWS